MLNECKKKQFLVRDIQAKIDANLTIFWDSYILQANKKENMYGAGK